MHHTTSMQVVWAVAEETGADPTSLPPLNHVIDTDALNALFRPASNVGRPGRPDCELRFSYAGQDVLVRGEEITVGGTGPPSDPPAE